MSERRLPKCSEFIPLSAPVILSSSLKAAGDYMRNANKSTEMPYSTRVRELET